MAQQAASFVLGRRGTGSAERFFQWSLFLLLLTGFVALAGTGKLDFPSLALVAPALLLRGYFLLQEKDVLLPERWTSYLTIAYFAFYAADYFYLSQTFVSATVHMVLFSMVVKIFSVRRNRDLVYLIALAFMMVLAAAVLTVDTVFLLTFALFSLVAMATFVSMEMRRSETSFAVAHIPARQDWELNRYLAAVSLFLCLTTLAGSVVIFLVLPRLSSRGYLRNFGVQSAMTTGFSQDVRLGGIGQIQQSNAVVMHIQILSGRLPADPKWRGVALARFDGQRWWNSPQGAIGRSWNASASIAEAAPWVFYSASARLQPLPTLRYRVIMEPVGLNIFFLAPIPLRVEGNYRSVAVDSSGSVFTGDASNVGVYVAEADGRDPKQWINEVAASNYPDYIRRQYLALPSLDPRIPALARRITASSQSDFQRARDLEFYLSTKYGYTLELPGPQTDPLANFLFVRKKGHCEYFASAMTVMLRSLGIPARMVNGFRGGEYNDVTGSYIIRERDAHSWVEAFFPQFGWVTFDPTPAGTTPNREGAWSRLPLYLDAASAVWREWVINYDFSHQIRLSNQLSATTGNVHSKFREWLTRKYRVMLDVIETGQRRMERMSPLQMTIACVILGVLLALPFIPRAWRNLRLSQVRRDPRRAPSSAASFWYLRLVRKLARRGIRKTPAQTPEEFASSIQDPRLRQNVVAFTDHYERARFDGSVEDAERLPELYDELVLKK